MIQGAPILQIQQETFERLEPEWRALLPGSCVAAPFLTPTWLKVWWEHFGAGHELCLWSFREGEQLRGLAPMMRTGAVLSFVALTDICDYHDFIFPCGSEEPYFRALLEKLMADHRTWACIQLEGLREGSAALAMLPGLAAACGLTVTVTQEEVSPHIPIMPTWDGYLASLDGKDRHELRRKLRRLESAGSVRIATAATATLSQDVAEFLEMLKDSRETKAAFLTTEREQFFHDLAKTMDAEGLLKLFFLELDGKRLAGAFCFDYENSYYLYNSGYDTRYASLSVGLLLKALLVRDAIQKGKREYDLLRGAETYKYHLGAKDRWLHRMVIERK